MRNLLYIVSILAVVSCETVKFQQQALYDSYATPMAREVIEPVIFSDAEGTMWNSLFECGDFKITSETAYSGKSSIKISWDKGLGCDWIGFGNSFSNWTAVDMSELRFKKALSFYVRTQEKTARSIPIVAALEDFGGGGSYYFVDAGKYLIGLEIDTTWKRIIVPLWHFPVNEEEVDIYSIKQMQFQLEGAGSFYLDEIKLIDYTEEDYKAMREKVEAMKPEGELNHIVYRAGQLEWDAWGVGEKFCHTLKEVSYEDKASVIKWNFDATDCTWAKWGINWNDWYQINLRGVTEKAILKFSYKASPSTNFVMKLVDFNGNTKTFFTASEFIGSTSNWNHVTIPLSDLNLKERGFLMDQIKQLEFEGLTKGEVIISDIKITGNEAQ